MTPVSLSPGSSTFSQPTPPSGAPPETGLTNQGYPRTVSAFGADLIFVPGPSNPRQAQLDFMHTSLIKALESNNSANVYGLIELLTKEGRLDEDTIMSIMRFLSHCPLDTALDIIDLLVMNHGPLPSIAPFMMRNAPSKLWQRVIDLAIDGSRPRRICRRTYTAVFY